VVAIDETLYCYEKYVVTCGDHSIATLIIVVAIGETLCCHDKCLVARDVLSIATLNVVVAIVKPSIDTKNIWLL